MNMATQDPKDDLNEDQAFCRVLSVRRRRRRHRHRRMWDARMGIWEGCRRSHQSINVILYFPCQVPTQMQAQSNPSERTTEAVLQRQWQRQLGPNILHFMLHYSR